MAKVIVWDEADSNTTVPVPALQFAEVLEFDHAPPTVHVPLPMRRYAVALVMETLPVTVTMETAPDPSRSAEPERTRSVPTVRPVPEEDPIVIAPPAWVRVPLTPRLNVPRAIVPAHPVVFREVTEAFWSRVTMPPPEFASKMTFMVALGTEQPPAPPEVDDQCAF